MANKSQQEETPNPYNAKKAWHKPSNEKFVSSQNLFFANEAPESEEEEIEIEASMEKEEVKEKPYKRPNYKKRYDDMKTHYDKQLNQWRQEKEELLNEVQISRPEYKAPKTPEELEQFKEQYPEVFEVVETVSHMQSEARTQELQEQLQSLQQRDADKAMKEAEQRLVENHPDLEEIRNSGDFEAWTQNQPDAIRDWISDNANDAELASRILDLYKKDKGMDTSTKRKSSSRKTRKSAADMVSTKTTTVEPTQEKIWSEKEIAAMSVAEFDKYEQEISDAMQDGRIVK